VWCADADGVVDTTTVQGHDGPLTELDVGVVELTQGAVALDHLIDACARRFQWLASYTVCEAYADADALRRFAATEFVSDQYGEVGAEPPGFPVVVRGKVQCEDIDLQTGPAAAQAAAHDLAVPDRLRAWRATESFNVWRSRVALCRDLADGGCLDFDTAREHAVTAQSELDGTWPILVTARDPDHPSHARLCADVRLQRSGFIEVGYHAVQSPGGRSGSIETGVDAPEPEATGTRSGEPTSPAQ
jgi:hypothetical protein